MHLIGKDTIPDTLPETPIVYLPTWDRVLIRRRDSNKTTRLGLLLPENFRGKLMEGVVLAVGPGRMNDQGAFTGSHFKVGDVVLFSDEAGLRADPDAPDQFMVASQSILAVRA